MLTSVNGPILIIWIGSLFVLAKFLYNFQCGIISFYVIDVMCLEALDGRELMDLIRTLDFYISEGGTW